MLDELQNAGKNLKKFKRGLSIFEDHKIKESLLDHGNAPLFNDQQLSKNFQNFLQAHQKDGPKGSVTNIFDSNQR